MSNPVRYGLIGAGALLLLLLIAPFLIPAGAYRAQIEKAAFEQTGRVLKIEGGLRVTLFPSLGVTAQKVSLANVPGGHAKAFVSADDLHVAVRVWPLLSGRVEVSEIELERPVVNLERDRNGQGNWTFKSPASNDKSVGGFSTRFSGIHLSNGRVSYRNVDGKVRTFERADLTIGLTSPDRPVTLDGDFVYRKRHVALEARIDSLTPLGQGPARATDVSLTSDLLQASFKGDVAGEGGFEGAIKFDTTNMRGLAEWLGEILPKDAGFKTLSLEGRIEAHGSVVTFPETSLRLDTMTVTGRMGIDLGGKRPVITGDVVVDRLDLNRYIETGAPSGGKPASGNGWSNEPIELSILHLFDASLTIDTGVLRLKGLHIGKTHLTASLTDGLLDVVLDPMALYGGGGKARLVVDARAAKPVFRNELRFDKVAMLPLLNDSINVQRINGRGTLVLAVSSQGSSASEVIRNLTGKGSLRIADGRIMGVDLGAVARLIRTALTLEATKAEAATPFTEMGGSFVIAKGVLATKDFRMDGKVLRATGAGTVDLGNRTIDFLVQPKAVLLPIGTGLGVGFPFRAHGPWQSVTYSADVAGAVTGLVSDVFKSAMSVPGAIGGLFTGPDKQKPQPKKKKKSGGLFDGLFGP
jgi:AsmA protein